MHLLHVFTNLWACLYVQTRAMVAALSLLADAYLAVADKAAAEALAAFKAEQGSASFSPAGAGQSNAPGEGQASQDPSTSGGQDASQASRGRKQVTWEQYPDHVHDPLKVQLELGNVKGAALQTVTELHRGLLYVALHHCHGQRSL